MNVLWLDPLIAVRGVHFAATLLACGTVCFMALVAEKPAPLLRRRLTTVVLVALAFVVLSGLAWLALVAANILDASLADICLHGRAWPVATGTRFGEVTCLRLGVAGLLGLSMWWPRAIYLQLVGAAALAGLLALVGHAGATLGTAGTIHLVSDAAHLLAAAAWVGGLPALAMTLHAARRELDANAALSAVSATRRFSVLGIVCVTTLIASGLINSVALLSGPGDLITTTYGRLLLFKIGLFGVMLAIAAHNRYRLTPRLPADPAVAALLRNCWAETGLGLAILLVVGALGTMPPGAHMHINAAQPPDEAAFVHIHTAAVMADLTINPGHIGKTAATIRLSREDSTEFPAKYVTLELQSRDGGAPSIRGSAVRNTDGEWFVSGLDIPGAGVWVARISIHSGATLPLVLDAPIVIMQCSNECW